MARVPSVGLGNSLTYDFSASVNNNVWFATKAFTMQDNTMPGTIQRILKTRTTRWTLLIAMGFLLLSLVVAWVVGGRLVASANHSVEAPDNLAVVDFQIESRSGSTIAGWTLSSKPGDPVVVLLHPIRGNRSTMLGRARLLHERGFSVVLILSLIHI